MLRVHAGGVTSFFFLPLKPCVPLVRRCMLLYPYFLTLSSLKFISHFSDLITCCMFTFWCNLRRLFNDSNAPDEHKRGFFGWNDYLIEPCSQGCFDEDLRISELGRLNLCEDIVPERHP